VVIGRPLVIFCTLTLGRQSAKRYQIAGQGLAFGARLGFDMPKTETRPSRNPGMMNDLSSD
jgi:hypothetical protein